MSVADWAPRKGCSSTTNAMRLAKSWLSSSNGRMVTCAPMSDKPSAPVTSSCGRRPPRAELTENDVSELRHDPLTRDWVVIAPERGQRPHSVPRLDRPPLNSGTTCPFCPGHENDTPPELWRVPRPDGSWQVRVVETRYPVVAANGPARRSTDAFGSCPCRGLGTTKYRRDARAHWRPVDRITRGGARGIGNLSGALPGSADTRRRCSPHFSEPRCWRRHVADAPTFADCRDAGRSVPDPPSVRRGHPALRRTRHGSVRRLPGTGTGRRSAGHHADQRPRGVPAICVRGAQRDLDHAAHAAAEFRRYQRQHARCARECAPRGARR